MNSEYVKGSKRWLSNNDWETGAVASLVEVMGKKHKSVQSFFTIRDCSRSVSLVFDFWGEDSLEERLQKVDTLQEELGLLRERLVEAAQICRDSWESNKDGE